MPPDRIGTHAGFALALASLALWGCATTPQGRTSYYFPKADTQLSITQTLTCNSAGDTLHQVVTVTPTTAYSSDLSVPPFEFKPKDFSGVLSDSDIAITFTDDGRLSGINVTNTGQGGAIVKDILAVAKAVFPAAAPRANYDAKAACKTIDAQGVKAGAQGSGPATITLNYLVGFSYVRIQSAGDGLSMGIRSAAAGPNDPLLPAIDLALDAGSAGLFLLLRKDIPRLGFSVTVDTSKKLEAAHWANASSSDQYIKLNSAAVVNLSVLGSKGNLEGAAERVWTGQVTVPLTGKDDLFTLPIPKAKPFGSQKFSLSLSAFGSMSKLEYATTGVSDTADALAAIGGFVASSQVKTTAQQAAALQSQADLIYQQQRLAICQANPTSCPGK